MTEFKPGDRGRVRHPNSRFLAVGDSEGGNIPLRMRIFEREPISAALAASRNRSFIGVTNC
jgi:hypothetical protein